MARIYKESRYVLQLLIGKSYVAQYDDVKISFYTKNPNNQVMVDNGITIKRNIAEVKIESTLFDNLEEGLISYIVYGTKDGIPFIEERQSNYFLKAPLDFKPGEGGSCNLENKSVTPSMGERNNDGYIIVEEDEGYDGLSRVVIDPQTLYNEGVNEQKSKLESISITENGTYAKEDGYNHIEVNVPDLNGSYEQGKTDGVNEQKGKLESINITENGTYTKEDGYNHIEVNVNAVPKVNVEKVGLKFGYSSFTEVPEWADFNGITNMAQMFYYCIYLQTIPLIDTSNVMNMAEMFYYCYDLQTIPPINTSNAINMNRMFYNCKDLKTIPELDARKLNSINECFRNGGSKVTDVGGWKNLKCKWDDNYGLKNCPNLTYQSCINILNGLYDFTGNGETPGSNQGQLKVHQNFLDKVGDEISIGVAKGWTITA